MRLARQFVVGLIVLLAGGLVVVHFRSLWVIECVEIPLPRQCRLIVGTGAGRVAVAVHEGAAGANCHFVYPIPPAFRLDTLSPETLRSLLLETRRGPEVSFLTMEYFRGPGPRERALLIPTPIASAVWVAIVLMMHAVRCTATTLRGRRRLGRGLCPTCCYNLHSTPYRCPECGRAAKRPLLLAGLAPGNRFQAALSALLIVLLSPCIDPISIGKAATASASGREPGRGYTERIATTRHPLQRAKVVSPSIEIDMVYIPAGTFLMGSPESESGHSPSESPLHLVQIDGFWMSRCEIPWEVYWAWEQAMPPYDHGSNSDPSYGDPTRFPAPEITGPPRFYGSPAVIPMSGSNPITGLTPYAGQRLCQWLTRTSGRFYRLPTEGEWEYAARAGSQAPYFFGSDARRLSDFAQASAALPTLPGTRRPNLWGLYDMYGNVAEWTLDGWRDRYTVVSREPTRDPFVSIGPPVDWGGDSFGVVRGGAWDSAPESLRSAARQQQRLTGLAEGNDSIQNWYESGIGVRVGFRIVSPLRRHHDERERPTRPDLDGG